MVRTKTYDFVKRSFDIGLSLIMIIVLLPFLSIVFIGILLECGNYKSVIYTQTRLGKDSIPFNIYKFRSMIVNAPVVASKDLDPNVYVTKTGRLLRKTSIDELPQLFNILKGDMSFVGPRPLIPNEGEIIDLRKKYGIDSIYPGLTGWAQIKDREITNVAEKIELEYYYLKNQNMLLDIKIFLLTIFTLKGR